MPQVPFTQPVEDTIAKVDDTVAVGEDLEFQERWWRFERITWSVFALLLALDLAGAFGRGPLAEARARTEDGAVEMKYERIVRTGTPTDLTLHFGPDAIVNGQIRLFLSDTAIDQLGARRIAPQPAVSAAGDGGVTYTFEATHAPATVTVSLTPSSPGVTQIYLDIPGHPPIKRQVVIMP